jgi:PAS domain S-box-containing protein
MQPGAKLGFELFELLPEALLVVDQRGVIQYANHQAGELFGRGPDTLVSTTVETLLPEYLRERHIIHRNRYDSEPRIRSMGSGFEVVAQRADGSIFPVDIVLNPLKHLAEPMVLAVVRDMTDRRAIEQALGQCRAKFDEFYEHPPDAIILMDEDGKIDRVDPIAEAVFGLSRAHMLGQPIEMLIPERFRARHVAYRTDFMREWKTRHMGTDLQLWARRGDGSEFPVDIMLTPMEIDQRKFVLVMVRDITAHKRSEEQVQLLMREINHRAKNMLSLVQVIARQTATREPEEFIDRFTERIQALAANQDLLIRNKWQGVDLEDLVRAQLAHFVDLIGSRIAVGGPRLHLGAAAAQAIGLTLHELATNAGKYGALSTDTGRVDVDWHIDGDVFTMKWTERKGPPVRAPERQGFGSTVIDAMAKRTVDGEVQLEFAPAGLAWRLTCPRANALNQRGHMHKDGDVDA